MENTPVAEIVCDVLEEIVGDAKGQAMPTAPTAAYGQIGECTLLAEFVGVGPAGPHDPSTSSSMYPPLSTDGQLPSPHASKTP